MLELYCNFFDRFFDVDKFEELEIATDSFYLELAKTCTIALDLLKRKNGRPCERRTVMTFSEPIPRTIVLQRACCSKHKKHDKRETGLFKKNSDVPKWFVSAAKLIVATMPSLTNTILVAKVRTKETLDETGDGPMEKYWRVIEEVINFMSTSRGIRVLNHRVGTYEQTMKGLSYFYPKQTVLADGNHIEPLKL